MPVVDWNGVSVNVIATVVAAGILALVALLWRSWRKGGRPSRKGSTKAAWIPRLNAFLQDEAEVRLIDAEPIIRIEGQLVLSEADESRAQAFRQSLEINDSVAVLSSDLRWDESPTVIHVHVTDYASVCALDEVGRRPTMLSANAVVFCEETEELVAHRRAAKISRDYPCALHTFGGAFMPSTPHGRGYDRLSLLKAACREVNEESGLGFDLAALPPLLLGRERIGFVHLAIIGVNISAGSLDRAEASPEGDIVRIPWSELPRKLASEQWVPAGKAQVLSWLALGAPTGQGNARFGSQSGSAVFDLLVP